MQQDIISASVEKYTKANKRKKRWHRIVSIFAAIVVFCTTYILILPAITLEKDCEIPEHTHSDGCYMQITSVNKRVPICTIEGPIVHQHDLMCYDENGELWCTLEEIEPHVHDESCYSTTESGEPELICDKDENLSHQHTDECFAVVEQKVDTESLTCTNISEEHVHNQRCYGQWELICTMQEHVHSENCKKSSLSEEDQALVDNVQSKIDALPSTDEIGEKLNELEEAEDEVGYENYFLSISSQVTEAYDAYRILPDELKEKVENVNSLTSLESLLPIQTLEITDTLTVYQINSYKQAATTLVYGGSVREKLGTGMSFTYWDVVVVEKNSNGNFYVSEYVSQDGSKLDYKANTADGFVLLLYNQSVDAVIGETVVVDVSYKTTAAYNSLGHGTVRFGVKADKDNSGKLDIIQGADTKALIEVNLYDYDEIINTLYSGDKNYPGFQQDKGTTRAFSKLNTSSFNFGNNITNDLAAGNPSVTNQGGDINKTENGANSPISGAMSQNLNSEGYPALADGTSLEYLFSNSQYAKKVNKSSINGLFLYNDETGAYTFNSRENHAQFNSDDDTFTLYEQIISSNFMMYPFGNFLPLNDIVYESAQVSTIDREYLKQIADSAEYKYNLDNNANAAYGTLATRLRNFIDVMDASYPDGWNASDCMNEYFKVAGIDRTFEQDGELVKKIYSIDYDEPTDFYFGMEMKMNFIQPKDGLTGKDGKQQMVFYFTGDDDVWVYIDGVLFLDLSGIHRHVGGEIDFVNGVVKYYSLDVTTGDVSKTPYKTVKFSELVGAEKLNENGTFTDYSTHSFNFYYMERGAGSGVCRMNFNFPLLHKNTVSVTKEISTDEQDKLKLLGDPDFMFQILKEGGDDLFIGEYVPYDIFNLAGNKIGSDRTDENGVFKLKANQTAVFKEIAENAGKYFVRELLNSNAFEQYGKIIVDGSSETTNYNVTVGEDTFRGVNSPVKDVSDGSTSFIFNNQVTFKKLGKLSITKTLAEYSTARDVLKFDFEVSLDGKLLPVGTEYTIGDKKYTVQQEGIITLAPDETAVISNILAGSTFKVVETQLSADGYVTRYTFNGQVLQEGFASGVIQTEHTAAVIVNNSEKGASVSLQISKILQSPDGKEHTYTFVLEQVTEKNGLDIVEPKFVKTTDISITGSKAEGLLEIGYSSNSMTQLPQTFYYRITEAQSEETATIFDTSVYVIEVTVTDESGTLTASITNVWKDGIEQVGDLESTVVFTNRISQYELPETGGSGTHLYTVGGLLLTSSAVMIWLCRKKVRKKGDVRNS